MMMKSKGTPGEAGVVEASQEHNLKNIAGQHPCRAVIIVVILMNAVERTGRSTAVGGGFRNTDCTGL